MKKVLISIFGLVALAGCASHYDYYQGGVRYTQDGPDCIYYSGEKASRFSEDVKGMRDGKKIVYRNTLCADLYAQDTFGQAPRQDRKILTPAAQEVPCAYRTSEYKCGCNSCVKPVQPVLTRRYVIVSAM